MKELIAKRYTKALINNLNNDELVNFIAKLSELSMAFSDEKFTNIISTPTLSTSNKVNFLLSISDEKSVKFTNFIKLLGENKRIEILPNIVSELLLQKSKIDNTYYGNIYADFEVSLDQISQFEASFSKKFGAKILLKAIKSDYSGVKIELDDLGVEVSFSLDRLKAQMSEFILKAI